MRKKTELGRGGRGESEYPSSVKVVKKASKTAANFYVAPAKKRSYHTKKSSTYPLAGTLFPIDVAKPHPLGLYFAGNFTIIGSPVTSKFL